MAKQRSGLAASSVSRQPSSKGKERECDSGDDLLRHATLRNHHLAEGSNRSKLYGPGAGNATKPGSTASGSSTAATMVRAECEPTSAPECAWDSSNLATTLPRETVTRAAASNSRPGPNSPFTVAQQAEPLRFNLAGIRDLVRALRDFGHRDPDLRYCSPVNAHITTLLSSLTPTSNEDQYYYHYSILAGQLVPEGAIEDLVMVENTPDPREHEPRWDDKLSDWLAGWCLYRPLTWVRQLWDAGWFMHITSIGLLVVWVLLLWVCFV
jgi:hypothetical protein